MAIFVGIASYGRPNTFAMSIKSLLRTRIPDGFIITIDTEKIVEREKYMQALKPLGENNIDIILDLSLKRRGSTSARNIILDLAEQNLKKDDILILYDDDYICPGYKYLVSAIPWLKLSDVGLVGGKVINIYKRKIDPDFYLNIRGLADALTRLTGFIFLDTNHGPRYVDFTTPLMAMRVELIKRGIRYDPNYLGTSYREESDIQMQVRKLGYKIIFEPNFLAYHLNLEQGGNRSLKDIHLRFYWKARNNIYFIKKHKLGMTKLLASTLIITSYALLNGLNAVKAVRKGIVHGLLAR